jgi:hypothetical protein
MSDYFVYLAFLSDIDHAFRDALTELNSYSNNSLITVHKFNITYDSIFPNLIDTLKNYEIHESDGKILLDCQFLVVNIIKNNLGFITKDNAILKAKKDIETLLPGTHIFNI